MSSGYIYIFFLSRDSHINFLYTFSDNIWKTDLDFLVNGGHQSGPFNTTLKLHIEPKTQSVLVPQSSSSPSSVNRSCKSYFELTKNLKVWLKKKVLLTFINSNIIYLICLKCIKIKIYLKKNSFRLI